MFLRLRMKVWTHPGTKNRYLVSVGFANTKTGLVRAYVMSDEGTQERSFSVEDFNALPYYYFKEDGEAPHAGVYDPDKPENADLKI